MSTMTISAFADEIDPMLSKQMQVLNDCGITHMEIRGVDDKGIITYSLDEVKEIKKRLDANHISVSAVGSPIGKISIKDDFAPHFEQFCHTVEIAHLLGSKYIRLFSFFMPKDEDPAMYREEVLKRMRQMVEYAKTHDIILLHENEKDIYGDIAPRCLDLFKELYCEHFQCTFDFANFVQCKQDTLEAFSLLKPYIAYVHIKDALWDSGKVVPAGKGDGKLAEILAVLKKEGYNGFITLEPHLIDFAGLAALEQNAEKRNSALNGEEAFKVAFESLNGLLKTI